MQNDQYLLTSSTRTDIPVSENPITPWKAKCADTEHSKYLLVKFEW